MKPADTADGPTASTVDDTPEVNPWTTRRHPAVQRLLDELSTADDNLQAAIATENSDAENIWRRTIRWLEDRLAQEQGR